MKLNTALFSFRMKTDVRFPQFFSLFQQDNQKSVLRNTKARSLLFDILMDARWKANLR